MLSTEERTILDNIKSLMDEIYQMESAEPNQEEKPMVEQALKTDDSDEDDVEKTDDSDEDDVKKAQEYGTDSEEEEDKKDAKKCKAKKAITTASPDGATASSDADEKIEDLPEEADEGIKEVAKQLFKLLGRGEVKKSKVAPKQSNHLSVAIQGLTQVVKSLMKRQGQNDSIINDILQGLGVAKQIDDTYGVKKSNNRPVANTDTNLVLKEVRKMAKKSDSDEANGIDDVRSVMKSNLAAFFKG